MSLALFILFKENRWRTYRSTSPTPASQLVAYGSRFSLVAVCCFVNRGLGTQLTSIGSILASRLDMWCANLFFQEFSMCVVELAEHRRRSSIERTFNIKSVIVLSCLHVARQGQQTPKPCTVNTGETFPSVSIQFSCLKSDHANSYSRPGTSTR